MENGKSRFNISDDISLSQQLEGFDSVIEELRVERLMAVEKAISSNNPVDFIRAHREMESINARLSGDRDGRAFLFDPMAEAGMGFRDKPFSNLSYSMLRGMARTPIIKGIIGTRQSQVFKFSNYSDDDSKEGWQIIRKRKLFDNNEELSDSDKREISRIAEFVLNSGDARNKWHADTFDKMLQKWVKDTYEIDQVSTEFVRNKKNELVEFYSVDGATVRYSSNYYRPQDVDSKYLIDGHPPIYVQLYNGRVNAEFYPWEMMLGIRNDSTDIYANGYGTSETEDLFRVITWMLNSDTYNGKFFTNGSLPRGYFKIGSKIPKSTFNNLRSRWTSMVRGVENAHRTPFMEGDVEWQSMQQTNNDMQFHQWVEYLIRVASAVYKIDPSEIGFTQQGSGGSLNLSHKQRTDHSQDKGLYPLLIKFQAWINHWLISELNPDYEFVFTGITSSDEGDSIKNDISRVSNWSTLDEIRKKNGLEPLGKDSGGDIVLNSQYIQYLQMNQMGGSDSNEYIDDNEDIDKDTEEQDELQKSLTDWINGGMVVSDKIMKL